MAPLLQDVLGTDVVSPYDELMAYEYLYSREGSTLKKIVEATVLSNKLPREALYDLYGLCGSPNRWVTSPSPSTKLPVGLRHFAILSDLLLSSTIGAIST